MDISPPVSRVAWLGEPVSVAGIALLHSCRSARWMPTRTTRLNDRRSKHPDVPGLERGAYTRIRSLHFGEKKDVLVQEYSLPQHGRVPLACGYFLPSDNQST